jgi:predicted DNA-binding transcriptional regulator AlpA
MLDAPGQQQTPVPEPDRLLRIEQVEAITGFDRETLARHAAAGSFPTPVRALSSRRWRQSDIERWLRDLPSWSKRRMQRPRLVEREKAMAAAEEIRGRG